MEYAKEEVEFVRFCAQNIACNGAECPGGESCEKGSEICLTLTSKMEEGIELAPEHKEIISYFLTDQLWRKGTCTPKKSDKECPNRKLCDERGKEGQKSICEELLSRLGLHSVEGYRVLESEIQKILVNNLSSLNWGVGEELLYYDEHPKIAVGQPDILLRGKETNTLYVVELKSGLGLREDVGQLQGYVGWYKENMPAQFKAVKGILLAKELDEGSKYALKANPDLEGRLFHLHIEIKKGE